MMAVASITMMKLKKVELKVILVLFPTNATHLIQPLDIAVLKPFKSMLKIYILDFMLENAITTISLFVSRQIGRAS